MVRAIAGLNIESVFGRTVNSGQSETAANALAENARSIGSTDQYRPPTDQSDPPHSLWIGLPNTRIVFTTRYVMVLLEISGKRSI